MTAWTRWPRRSSTRRRGHSSSRRSSAPRWRRAPSLSATAIADSTLAYQGYGRGLDLDTLDALNRDRHGRSHAGHHLPARSPVAEGLRRRERGASEPAGQRRATPFTSACKMGIMRWRRAEPDAGGSIDARGAVPCGGGGGLVGIVAVLDARWSRGVRLRRRDRCDSSLRCAGAGRGSADRGFDAERLPRDTDQ